MNGVLLVLVGVSLMTSALSAIIGMGGGILLLATLFCFLPHGQAIPVHAVVQLASNSTRILAYLGNVDRATLLRFTLGVLPGSALGLVLLWRFGKAEASQPYLKMVVGIYILVAPFIPKGWGSHEEHDHRRGFTVLGLIAGALALTVGAVGPLIGPIFARRGFVKERLIATKAACQMVTHLIKIPAFFMLGTFASGELWAYALPMAVVVIPGTLLGRRLIKFVSPSAFRVMYRGALVVAGLKVLIFDGILKVG